MCPGYRALWSLSAAVSKATRSQILPPFQQGEGQEQIGFATPEPSFPPPGTSPLPWAPIMPPFPGSSTSHPCSDFISGMNRYGPFFFFPPSKTGLLGPKPDMFSQLGKGEEWMPEDSLGGFCLGKHPACGRHWGRLSMCTGPVD